MNELKSYFIGPKSENGDFVEKLILDILRDQFYWRKNYHPEDKQYISEFDKSNEQFIKYEAKLRQELNNILAELKNGTPFFSPRYIGHMVSETTIPAIIGYFAAMLYNPNNVSSEASPVTTEYELIVGKMLCGMVGYKIPDSWGHITSGGTVANLEAMWVSRNILYLPVAIFKAMKELITLGNRWEFLNEFKLNGNRFLDFNGWELLNINPQITLNLPEEILNFILNKEKNRKNISFLPKTIKTEIKENWESNIKKFSIQSLGIQNFFNSNIELLKGIKPAVVIVPQTKHYSYTKIFDLLGMGSDSKSLIEIPCDANFRIDIKELKQKILLLKEEKIPIMSIISVFGTTEEGAIDSHEEISCLRKKLENENNLSFYLHSDAAWGGYFASLIYENNIIQEIDGVAKYKELTDFQNYYHDLLPNKSKEKIQYLFQNIKALKEYDSITLDPHKLGYIPYAAGGILFKSNLMKSLLTVNAPYVFYDDNSELKFIGKYILEGSKPGAAACACYLSHKVIPLNISGYGKLTCGTLATASNLYNQFILYSSEQKNNFEILPISEPDTNIVCFIVNFRNNKDINLLNKITDKIYQRFRFHNNADYKNQDYIISKTEFKYKEYKGKGTDKLLEKCGINIDSFSLEKEKEKADKINILRITCMNPLLSTENGKKQINDFVKKLKSFLEESFFKILFFAPEKMDDYFYENINNIEKNLIIKLGVELKTNLSEIEISLDNKINYDGFILPIYNQNYGSLASFFEIVRIKGKIRKPIIVISDKQDFDNLSNEIESYGFETDLDLLINELDFEQIINHLIYKKKNDI